MRLVLILLLALLVVNCGGPEPRRPVEVKSGSFYKESIERNKILIAKEEALIKEIIAKDTTHSYQSNPNGV